MPEFTDRFGKPVKIKSIQEEPFVCICVGSFISLGNPFEEVGANSFELSVVLMSLGHHMEDLVLKLPVITDEDGLRRLVLLKSFSKLDKNKSDSLLFWLGER